MAVAAVVLAAVEGPHDLAQATINGLVSGAYFALGAAGLTLVYGVLKLVNFAHGEFLTFGAYMAIVARSAFGFPLGLALPFAFVTTALLALAIEMVMWRPMRRKGAGVMQLLLMALGLAFVIRNVIQLIAGTDVRQLGANVTSSVTFHGLHIGRTELWVVILAFAVLVALATMLSRTRLGMHIRALSDNPELAATTGLDTDRIIVYTWILAGGLAGLAGVVYGASIGVITPNLGFGIVLSIFAAVIVGGIGDAYGALAGGILIGLVQEWSTLVVPVNLKVAVGFAATYGIFSLGLQLNVGTTGITNFGQAGFMAIGAYTMGILVVKEGWSWWWAMPAAIAASMVAATLVGLPSLRLRADYFAITTLAFSEIVRYLTDNTRSLTNGSQGLLGYSGGWVKLSVRLGGWLNDHDIHVTSFLFPLLLVSWALVIVLTLLVAAVVRTPWGRVLRAIREDEDAARALGKNTLAYKLQSLALSAALAAIAGFVLALNLTLLVPDEFDPVFTIFGFVIVILGGFGSYFGVLVGSIVLMTLLEGTRYVELPLAADKVAAIRFIIVGAVLILLMAFRPQGIFGKRQEMLLGE